MARSGRTSRTTGEDRPGLRRPADPLLVSVRSGAAISMPGMMDTILNLGLNDDPHGLILATGNPRFALDAYRRFIQMYGDVVVGIDGSVRAGDRRPQGDRRVKKDVDLTRRAPGSSTSSRASTARRPGADFPQDPRRAALARRRRRLRLVERPSGLRLPPASTKIPTTWAPPSTCVTMVFGNMGDDSGTGVCFTRDPAAGENGLYGEYLVERAGRGRRRRHAHPQPIAGCASNCPGLRPSSRAIGRRSRDHYREMQDVEFTVERGKLYMLQTRTGKRTAPPRCQDRGRYGREKADLAGRGSPTGRPDQLAASPCRSRSQRAKSRSRSWPPV